MWRCGGMVLHSHLPFELYRATCPIRWPCCGVEVGYFAVRKRNDAVLHYVSLVTKGTRAERATRVPNDVETELSERYFACAFSAGFPCGLPPARSFLEGFMNSEAMMPTTPIGTSAQKASIGSHAPADIDALNGSRA